MRSWNEHICANLYNDVTLDVLYDVTSFCWQPATTETTLLKHCVDVVLIRFDDIIKRSQTSTSIVNYYFVIPGNLKNSSFGMMT